MIKTLRRSLLLLALLAVALFATASKSTQSAAATSCHTFEETVITGGGYCLSIRETIVCWFDGNQTAVVITHTPFFCSGQPINN